MLEAASRESGPASMAASRDEAGDTRDAVTRITEVNARLASALADAGLGADDTGGEIGEWMRLVARADSAHRSRARVKDERKRLRADAAALRDGLLRYLHSQGAKPTEQPDTAAAIAEHLERLSASP